MFDATASLFAAIHPASGWRCLFTLPDRRHYWFQDTAQMAQAALAFDAQGLAVFHSCAAFTDPGPDDWIDNPKKPGKKIRNWDSEKREQARVVALRALWLDLDAGPGKAYPDAGAAYRALLAWLQATGLPPPTIVLSGGGLHAYWPLRDELALAQWQPLADALRALAAQHALDIDGGATIDAARILRPPGTHNRKLLDAAGKKQADTGGPARPVRSGPLTGPYSLSDLHALQGAQSAPQSTAASSLFTKPLPAYLQGVGTNAAMLNVGLPPAVPADPDLIADRCLQVCQLRDRAGNVPEPQWYAILGVLAHCGEDGRDAAHEWSSGDTRYTEADTDHKMDQYLANADGPTTCGRFNTLVLGLCAGCPHVGRVSSPIQLGREKELPAAIVAPAPPVLELPPLPNGFFWKGMMLGATRKPTEEDASTFHIVSEYPIVVQQLQETERTKRVSAVFRSWEPMAQSWRDFSLNMGEVVGTNGIGKMADHGVVINKKRWPAFINYIGACANEHRGTRHYGVRYEQFGWKTDSAGAAFVLGEWLLRAGAEPVRIHGSDEVDRRGHLMAPQGTQDAWSQAANRLIGHPGMEAHAFMLLAAFAAPLYHFTGEQGATFVHGVTRGSGRGKSTMLNAGATVLGQPDASSIIERDTMVAKFITLGTLCHLPIFFDEMRFPSPEDTKHYVLQGTLGRDKQRGKVEGGLRSDHLNWSTIHISAANLSLTDTVRFDGSEVAQAARIFEFGLKLPDNLKTTDGDAIMRSLRANSGTAGRAFIQRVLDNRDWVAKAVPARMKHYETVMQAGPEERFILRLFACVDVAGALVQQYKLLSCDLSRVMQWAIDIQRGNASRLAVDSAVDAGAIISQMVNDLTPHTIVMPKAQVQGKPSQVTLPLKVAHGELKARLEVEGRRLLIDIAAVRAWMQAKNHPFTEIQKELLDAGILKDARVRRTLAAGSGYSVGQVWCWQIDGNHSLLADLIDTVSLPADSNVVPLRGSA